MKIQRPGFVTLACASLVVIAAPAFAQDDTDLAAAARAAEARLQAEREVSEQAARDAEARAADMRRQAEQRTRDAEARAADRQRQAEQRARDVEARAADRERDVAVRQASAEERMRLAEERLTEAARQVAELSMQQLPRVERIERVIRRVGRPVLGIMVGNDDASASDGPVDGVMVLGVSPGGAAAEAGLRAEDIITSINGVSMAADSDKAARGNLFEFMEGVESGDVLDVEFRRNGKSMSTEVRPETTRHSFAFRMGDSDFVVPDAPLAPDAALAPGAPRASVFRDFNFFIAGGAGGFGDMEMVTLTERLGSYFGTGEGLLIVRAPDNEEFDLQDGDVILNIDGREPTSVSHAMRILGSYEPGETVSLEIMRDRRRRKIDIAMPERRESWVEPVVAPVDAPREERMLIIERE